MRKNMLGALSLMGLAMASSGGMMNSRSWDDTPDKVTPEELEKFKKYKEERDKLLEEERILSRGGKKFIYGEEVIYALSQKRADKKAKKRGLI